MKLIIQIPCFNEEQTLPLVFEKMPRQIDGIDEIEFQIIDDGSTDKTIEIAKSLGIDHIVRIDGKNRKWLGRAFKTGIDHALKQGADIVVNTDGDNQYPSEMIPALVRPILEKKAHLVIGDRDPGHVKEFSPLKRFLQTLGSNTVQLFSGSEVKDAVSGFRAYSKEALLNIHVLTNYTYTVDTLMQAHKKGLDVIWLPIATNKKTRDSRLISSLMSKVRKSGLTILRLFSIYEPIKTFSLISLIFFLPGAGLLARFLYFYFFVPASASGHIQSVVVGGALLVIAVQVFILGILAELLSVNRGLLEEVLTRVKKLELISEEADEASSKPERIRVGK